MTSGCYVKMGNRHFPKLRNLSIAVYINHSPTKQKANRTQRGSKQQRNLTPQSLESRSHEGSIFCVHRVYGILCHDPVFSGSCPTVRDLFKRRLLHEQAQTNSFFLDLMLYIQCYREELKFSFSCNCINNFVFSLNRVSFFGFGP